MNRTPMLGRVLSLSEPLLLDQTTSQVSSKVSTRVAILVDMVRGIDISNGFSRCIESPPGLISLVTPFNNTCELVMETGHLILALGYFRFSLSEAMTVPLVRFAGFSDRNNSE